MSLIATSRHLQTDIHIPLYVTSAGFCALVSKENICRPLYPLAEFICPILKSESRPFSCPAIPFLLNKNQSSSGEVSVTSPFTNRLIFIALSLELNAQSSAVKLSDCGCSHRDLRIVDIDRDSLTIQVILPYLHIIYP